MFHSNTAAFSKRGKHLTGCLLLTKHKLLCQCIRDKIQDETCLCDTQWLSVMVSERNTGGAEEGKVTAYHSDCDSSVSPYRAGPLICAAKFQSCQGHHTMAVRTEGIGVTRRNRRLLCCQLIRIIGISAQNRLTHGKVKEKMCIMQWQLI